jgi:type I restriction enzyme M protein
VWVIDSKAVRSGDLSPSHDERTSLAFLTDPKNARAKVEHGDVLLNSTGRGTLGRAACWLWHGSAIADNHVAILRPDARVCLPLYLALFLNSPPGLAQSEMFQTGSSGQLELYPSDVVKIVVYLPANGNGKPDLKWQQRLADKVMAAHAAKADAIAKLEEAKTLVEREIEKRKGP